MEGVLWIQYDVRVRSWLDRTWRVGREPGSWVVHICARAHARAHHYIAQEPGNHAKNATAAWNLPIPSTKIMG